MAKSDLIECEGVIEESLRNAQFRVRLDGSDKLILAQVSGKIRTHNIRLVKGDRVKVSVSPYNLDSGIITFRISDSRASQEGSGNKGKSGNRGGSGR